MRHRRWRVSKFNNRIWVDHRYYKTDQEAFNKHVLNGKQGFYSRMHIQVKPGGVYFPPGGMDCLLWISGNNKTLNPFGETREYWENILSKAKIRAASIIRKTQRT